MKYLQSLLAVCLAVGCSKVVVDPDGNGGMSGDDDGSGAGAGKQEASSTSGFDPVLCDQFCGAVGLCFASCTGDCGSFLQPPCGAEGEAVVECLVDNYDATMCSVSGCEPQMQELLACRSTMSSECDGGGCGGTDMECACTSQCPGGQRKALCTNEGGTASCACYLSSIPVYSCTGSWVEYVPGACSLDEGCCAEVFGSCTDCV